MWRYKKAMTEDHKKSSSSTPRKNKSKSQTKGNCRLRGYKEGGAFFTKKKNRQETKMIQGNILLKRGPGGVGGGFQRSFGHRRKKEALLPSSGVKSKVKGLHYTGGEMGDLILSIGYRAAKKEGGIVLWPGTKNREINLGNHSPSWEKRRTRGGIPLLFRAKERLFREGGTTCCWSSVVSVPLTRGGSRFCGEEEKRPILVLKTY